jgi:hypothetical protein
MYVMYNCMYGFSAVLNTVGYDLALCENVLEKIIPVHVCIRGVFEQFASRTVRELLRNKIRPVPTTSSSTS